MAQKIIPATVQYELKKQSEIKIDTEKKSFPIDDLEKFKQLQKEIKIKTEAFKKKQEEFVKERRSHQNLQNEFDRLSAQKHLLSLKLKDMEEERQQWVTELKHLKEKNSELVKENKYNQDTLDKTNKEQALLKTKISELNHSLKDVQLENTSKVTALLARIYEDYPTQEAVREARKVVEEAQEIRQTLAEEKNELLLRAEETAHEIIKKAEQEAQALHAQEAAKLQNLSQKVDTYRKQLDEMCALIDSLEEND